MNTPRWDWHPCPRCKRYKLWVPRSGVIECWGCGKQILNQRVRVKESR